MGKKSTCCVGGCNNDKRKPEAVKKHSHVDVMTLHRFPKKNEAEWLKKIEKGRKLDFDNIDAEHLHVCSNHFVDGEPTKENPLPTIFMTEYANTYDSTPKKRKKNLRKEPWNPR